MRLRLSYGPVGDFDPEGVQDDTPSKRLANYIRPPAVTAIRLSAGKRIGETAWRKSAPLNKWLRFTNTTSSSR